jgi:hypothetical protein
VPRLIWFVTRTSAPATALPLGSKTRPLIVPLELWPNIDPANSMAAVTHVRWLRRHLVNIESLPKAQIFSANRLEIVYTLLPSDCP